MAIKTRALAKAEGLWVVGIVGDHLTTYFALQVKAFLADPSAFVAAAPVAATPTAAPAAAAPAKVEAKEESEESDEDMGFGLFD